MALIERAVQESVVSSEVHVSQAGTDDDSAVAWVDNWMRANELDEEEFRKVIDEQVGAVIKATIENFGREVTADSLLACLKTAFSRGFEIGFRAAQIQAAERS